MRQDRVFEHFGGDVRIAVHVTADPAVDPQRRLDDAESLAVDPLERAIDFARELQHLVPENLLDIEENVLDLVADAGTFPANFVGLPEGGDLLADCLAPLGDLEGCERTLIPLLESVGDPVELFEDRATGRFRGVRGESEGHLEPGDCGPRRFGRNSRVSRALEHGAERASLRPPVPVARVCAGPTNAVVLLGQIDQPKVRRKRANDDDRVFEGQVGEKRRKLGRPRGAFLGGAAPPQDGQLAHPFLEGIQGLALLLDEDFAQDTPQRVHIASERSVYLALSTHCGDAYWSHIRLGVEHYRTQRAIGARAAREHPARMRRGRGLAHAPRRSR